MTMDSLDSKKPNPVGGNSPAISVPEATEVEVRPKPVRGEPLESGLDSATEPRAAPDVAPVDRVGAEEVDVWWGSYAGRTLLPSFAVCVFLTLAAVVAAVYFQRRYDLDPLAVRYAVYAIAALVWLGQLARWSYRVLTFSYRLTTRRLLLERSFFNSLRAAIDLRRIARIDVTQRPLERMLGVGRINVFEEGKSVPSMELCGVCRAEVVANVIREQAKQSLSAPPPA
jgi:membrane protein YdbS with pleckstrin-like domain